MIKVVEKDRDYVYIYSEEASEIAQLSTKMDVVLKTTYKGHPAILVKKENEKVKANLSLDL